MSALIRDVNNGFDDYRQWATDPTPRIGMGLPFFDGPTRGGIAKAECAMILAYSSVGKTSLALNWIVNNPQVPTIFFSLEMSWRLVVARLAAINTGTPTWELEDLVKRWEPETPPQLSATSYKYPDLLGVDSSELGMKDMKQAVLDAGSKLGRPIRLVVIDYMELIGGAGLLGKSEQIDRVAVKIRALAKDTDTSVVVLHQVGKGDGSDGYLPLSLDAGKYGGHHPMDYVIGAYAPRLDRKLGEMERERIKEEMFLQLLKNRSGMASPTGVRHRLSPLNGKLSEWSAIPKYTDLTGYKADMFTTPSRPEPEFDFA